MGWEMNGFNGKRKTKVNHISYSTKDKILIKFRTYLF
jgi:hypothetical protein